MERPEDIILRYSARGMTELREDMDPDFCRRTAEEILSWPRGRVLLTTGFFVAGHAETDGPAGTVMLAKALEKLGFTPAIVTDRYCRGYFEPERLPVIYMDPEDGEAAYRRLLARERPVGLISVERCGVNLNDDYANMRGVSIREHSARVDLLFDLAEGKIPTVGVGDGGNEIGMGNLREPICQKLSLVPCRTKVDHLVIATVSNWGAYGIVAWLQKLTEAPLMPAFEDVEAFIRKTVAMGCVDGVRREAVVSVDGFGMDTEREIIESLRRAAA